MSSLFETTYNPDVLSCIANLSNDEVFTPPELANDMLDLLPQRLWSDPNATFLDPACKSGIFLREIAKRLIRGLEDAYPDLSERLEHIYRKQIYGIAVTELTSLLSRRSLYCSKYPNSIYSVVRFDKADGNVRYVRSEHEWYAGKCTKCGATQDAYERDEALEQYAYEFIHIDDPNEVFDMKFDVIVGNPPYQLSTGQGQSQAKPVYHHFIEQAKKLNPRYLVMITPSRWMAGGMGLNAFREATLKDRHIKRMVDYSLSTECFPGVDIAGGINYFLWDREYDDDCEYTYIDGGHSETRSRKLNQYPIYVRNNLAIPIVEKVLAKGEESISTIMSSLGPFGLGTAERGVKTDNGNCYVLLSSAGRSFIKQERVKSGAEYISKWKVILGKATSAGAATADSSGMRKVIATLDILEPNAVCTFSYFIGGAFDTKEEAVNCLNYLATKFARFLLLQGLTGININKEKFIFLPLQDFTKSWDDATLYRKYGLLDEEVDLIETMIKPMAAGVQDDE